MHHHDVRGVHLLGSVELYSGRATVVCGLCPSTLEAHDDIGITKLLVHEKMAGPLQSVSLCASCGRVQCMETVVLSRITRPLAISLYDAMG